MIYLKLNKIIQNFWQFFNITLNFLEHSAGIPQDKFFVKDEPQYLNYAAIGSIIVHVVTYGIVEEGSQFDKDGKFVS